MKLLYLILSGIMIHIFVDMIPSEVSIEEMIEIESDEMREMIEDIHNYITYYSFEDLELLMREPNFAVGEYIDGGFGGLEVDLKADDSFKIHYQSCIQLEGQEEDDLNQSTGNWTTKRDTIVLTYKNESVKKYLWRPNYLFLLDDENYPIDFYEKQTTLNYN